VKITRNRLGHHLRLQSFVPTARRPGRQLRFEGVLSTADSRTLHAAIGQALAAGNGEPGPDRSSSSPGEPVAA